MKKKLLIVPVLFTVFLFATSCTNDDLPKSSDVIKNIQTGEWIISLYKDDGKDETYHFTGYSFVFNNGVITATRPSASAITGSYAKGTDDSKPKLILDFGSTSPFDELNEDWVILEETSVKIRLEDISGGNGGTDHLTFEKK